MTIAENLEKFFETHHPGANTSIYRDLLMNMKKIMEESPLDETERFLGLISIATAVGHKPLQDLAEEELKTRDLTAEQILEAKESAAIMAMLNTYYKFKGYLSPESVDNYQRAGLRMQSFMKPLNGKERFEMMALAVSVVNGCPSCIASHEKTLVQLGVSPEKIHDLARLAAVVKGLKTLTA